MIYGIGVDCVQIDRIAKSMARPRFAQRVYSAEEQRLFEARGEKRAAEAAAGNFAAKEAFLKAMGMGLGGLSLSDIAALRRESGEPYYRLSGGAAALCEEKGLVPRLSITHEGGLAIAFAVVEQVED